MTELDAEELGDVVAPGPYPLDVWRDEVVQDVLAHRHALTTQEVEYVRAVMRAQVSAAPTREESCHNDLGAGAVEWITAGAGLVLRAIASRFASGP